MAIRFLVPLACGIAAGALFLGQASQPGATPASAPASQPTSQAAAPNPAIPADLAKTIQNAIALTEQGNYRDLIETLAPPDAVAQMKGAGRFDQTVANFGQRAPVLLDSLHQALTLPPDISDDGNTATFHVTGGIPQMTFAKTGDKWVLR
ncbi:MAG TPA: hypothetical protein VH253_08895 [Phycisphaerae bacterium]|nr:hypothetical protein [Phycisphaerae bacterium]